MTSDHSSMPSPFERLALVWSLAVHFLIFSLLFAVISLGVITFPANLAALVATSRRLDERASWSDLIRTYFSVFRSTFVTGLVIAWPTAVIIALTIIDIHMGRIIPQPFHAIDVVGVLIIDYIAVSIATMFLIQLSENPSPRIAWAKTRDNLRNHRKVTIAYLFLLSGSIVISALWPLFALLGLGGIIVWGGNRLVLHHTPAHRTVFSNHPKE